MSVKSFRNSLFSVNEKIDELNQELLDTIGYKTFDPENFEEDNHECKKDDRRVGDLEDLKLK